MDGVIIPSYIHFKNTGRRQPQLQGEQNYHLIKITMG